MAMTATDDDIDHNQWNHPDEHDDNHERKCTCGPHASVDLTRAFRTRSESSSPSSSSSLGSLREQLWDACRRQGCFHVTVNVSQLHRHTAPSQEEGILSSLAGSVSSIHDDIHDMMSLGVAYGGGLHRNTTRNHPVYDSIHDGAATAATYRGRTAESGAAGGTRTNHPSLVVAAATAAEPKQSWEMRRCNMVGCHSPPPQETMGPNCRNEPAATTTTTTGMNHDLEESSLGLLAQQKLVDWTHDLHQVATVLMELLFLERMIHVPPASTTTTTTHQHPHSPLRTKEDHQTTVTQNVWLEPQPCAAIRTCQQIHNPLSSSSSSSSSLLNASSKREKRTTCCNVDLLRAFCYDAVELDTTTDNDDNNDDHRTNDKDDHGTRGLVLGSSPHTDWGTLTVVWQDSKGGLQTYCHAHDQWTNVEVLVPTSTTPTTNHKTTTTTTTTIGTTHADESSHPTTTNDTSGDTSTSCHRPQEEEDTIVSLFVHVGDFTSLATRGAWPSPRHRVLCPMTTRPSRTTTTTTSSSHANDDTTRENSVIWNKRDSPYDHWDSKNNDAREACRCSLVYFAYPPPGITLAMAQDAFQQQLLVWNNNSNNSHNNADENDIPFSHYSVLQNQSNNAYYPTQNMEQIMYQHIQSIPFDQVIQDKWNQVQRTS